MYFKVWYVDIKFGVFYFKMCEGKQGLKFNIVADRHSSELTAESWHLKK